MRMCVIAQTPLISPFGSIGFREREEREEGWREGGEAAGDAGRRRGEKEYFIFKKSMRNYRRNAEFYSVILHRC